MLQYPMFPDFQRLEAGKPLISHSQV